MRGVRANYRRLRARARNSNRPSHAHAAARARFFCLFFRYDRVQLSPCVIVLPLGVGIDARRRRALQPVLQQLLVERWRGGGGSRLLLSESS